VFVGGSFATLSGVAREYFAAVDATTGSVRVSYPAINGIVWSLEAKDGILYVGGAFGRAGAWPQVGFAAIKPDRVPAPPESRELALLHCAPNPTRTNTSIRYTLPGNQGVSLTVFDLQGRTVAKLLSNTSQTAGLQQVSLSTAGWRPGCYLYRLEAGRLSMTRKLVVLR
jgi:hypothetical protein